MRSEFTCHHTTRRRGSAHDEDSLGTIRAYGDRATMNDVTFNAGVFYGMDALGEAKNRADDNASGRREIRTADIGDVYRVTGQVSNYVTLGRSSQTVDVTAGNDVIHVPGEGGEPDPAQTDGLAGRVFSPAAPEGAIEVIRAAQAPDTLMFRPVLNTTDEIPARDLNSDGTNNWRGAVRTTISMTTGAKVLAMMWFRTLACRMASV